jgi:ATP-binding cassette subfamily E protein 1
MEAIQIINLPKNLESEVTHRYGPNSFKVHRLPIPRAGQVLGLVGKNGIGKSTALKVLAGKMKPNLGRFSSPPDWEEIVAHFRGSELQNYFTKILEDKLKVRVHFCMHCEFFRLAFMLPQWRCCSPRHALFVPHATHHIRLH